MRLQAQHCCWVGFFYLRAGVYWLSAFYGVRMNLQRVDFAVLRVQKIDRSCEKGSSGVEGKKVLAVVRFSRYTKLPINRGRSR